MNILYKTVISLLIAAITPFALSAQQKIDPTLEVTREFDGKMMNIHKSPLETNVADSLRDFALDFNYTIFDKPYKDLYEFTPIASARIYNQTESEWPVLLLKGGVSFPFTPEAALYFQPELKKSNFLSIDAEYTGFWGDLPVAELDRGGTEIVKGEKAPADYSRFEAGAGYAKYWKNDILRIAIGYAGGNGSYYNSHSHSYDMLEASAKIHSISKAARKINYSINLDYRHTSDKGDMDIMSLKENFFAARVEIGPNFGRYNKFTIVLNSENAFYSGIQDYRYGIFEIMPQYRFEKGRFMLLAGVKLSGKYKSKEKTGIDDFHNPVFINAKASVELVREKMWLYGEIGGGNRINSYFSMLGTNMRISRQADLTATTLPFTFQAGFKGNIRSRLSYDIFANYSCVDGLPQFINSGSDNALSLIYSETDILSLGIETGYASKRLNGHAKFTYSFFNDNADRPGNHYGYAPAELDLALEYNFRERIRIGTSINFRSETNLYDTRFSDPECSSPSYINLGVNVTYRFNRNFSLYAKGENLLDQTIMHSPVYIEKGLCAGIGIIVKF